MKILTLLRSNQPMYLDKKKLEKNPLISYFLYLCHSKKPMTIKKFRLVRYSLTNLCNPDPKRNLKK